MRCSGMESSAELTSAAVPAYLRENFLIWIQTKFVLFISSSSERFVILTAVKFKFDAVSRTLSKIKTIFESLQSETGSTCVCFVTFFKYKWT